MLAATTRWRDQPSHQLTSKAMMSVSSAARPPPTEHCASAPILATVAVDNSSEQGATKGLALVLKVTWTQHNWLLGCTSAR
jgi:hypothetical protein